MTRLLIALLFLVLPLQALAQTSNVRITGNDSTAANATTRTTLVTADNRLLVSSAASPTADSGAAITPVQTSAVASALVAKASPGNLYSVNIVTGASAGYLLVFNATSAPADGAVTPIKCLPIAANTGIETNMRSMPEYFSTGITIVFSTTGCFNKTASATAFISADVK